MLHKNAQKTNNESDNYKNRDNIQNQNFYLIQILFLLTNL